MTTVMEKAMADAGMKLPTVNKRIWLWLKDHPGSTMKTLASSLHIPAAQVATQLWQLGQRKMIEWSHDATLKPGNGHRLTKVYRVNPAMRGEYELLPLPVKATRAKAAPKLPMTGAADTPRPAAELVQVLPRPAAPAAMLPVSASTRLTAQYVMDNLSINEARQLYEQLRSVFEQR